IAQPLLRLTRPPPSSCSWPSLTSRTAGYVTRCPVVWEGWHFEVSPYPGSSGLTGRRNPLPRGPQKGVNPVTTGPARTGPHAPSLGFFVGRGHLHESEHSVTEMLPDVTNH